MALATMAGQRRCLIDRHFLWSTKAAPLGAFCARRRARPAVLITLSSALGRLASPHGAAQYLSMTLGLDHVLRFVEAPEANRAIDRDARERFAVSGARHRGRCTSPASQGECTQTLRVRYRQDGMHAQGDLPGAF